ncbi:MBOAT family O-acyltransferase [Euhalothece natronophila]|uniref:hypothetical protein n=1 Tax=Euhalothece natronophila TaxID=577489 RepID=UPI001647DD90|nr:hypothetical protein [Euhalothece natronophila]
MARLLTLLAIIVSWVVFRANTLGGSYNIIIGMFGGNGFILPELYIEQLNFLSRLGVQFGTLNNYGGNESVVLLLSLLGITLFLPNLYQIMSHEVVTLDIYNHLSSQKKAWYRWRPNFIYAGFTAVLLITALIFRDQPNEFLYFQF